MKHRGNKIIVKSEFDGTVITSRHDDVSELTYNPRHVPVTLALSQTMQYADHGLFYAAAAWTRDWL